MNTRGLYRNSAAVGDPGAEAGPGAGGVASQQICKEDSSGATICKCPSQQTEEHGIRRDLNGGSLEGKPASAEVVLAGDANTVTLVCTETDPVVPSSLLTNNKVCPKDSTLSECNADKQPKCAVSIHDFLHGEGISAVKWQKSPSSTEYTLSVPGSAAPLSDKFFWVGCSSSKQDSVDESLCKINVTLNARESRTIKGNVVQCAYGANSNDNGPQKVTLSPKANSLTLICGSEGAIQPTKYDEHYCSGNVKDDCSGAYKTVLPDFEKEWWTATPSTSDKTQYKLVIPEDKFPDNKQQILLGCRSSAVLPASRVSPDSTQSAGPTSCVVDVTIAAAASSSSAAAHDWFVTFSVSSVSVFVIGAFSAVH
ncbi:SAG-related sequence [Besnoitia besnoiti]|uniref:SAG-related sequence n=1 Tax=Besnoitia besnoiti TaxID=94643 RepID=A0A2A9MJW4_BESBE|nr:SAG-related sequence [Besnoitia besnoiti]PFH36256.1 SAG-related sequence [Besnoitia besnoiti]